VKPDVEADYPADHLSEFEFDGAEGLDFLEDFRVDEDEEMQFTKQGIIDYIEKSLEAEKELLEDKTVYEHKLNSEEAQIYLRKKGSRFDTKAHYSYVELTFND
jgi:hypothetical protein